MTKQTHTPLSVLDIPPGASFQVSYLRFAGSHGWIYRTVHDPEVARAHLRWVMDTANVGAIRVVIRPQRGPLGVSATFTLTRRTNLDAWHCPEIPDWELCCEERAAVAEAGHIIERHAQRGWTR